MKNALAVALALVVTGCATAPKPQPLPAPRPRPLLGEFGFDLSQVDRSVGASEDFYHYAAGGWRKANPLPSTYARYGRFEEVADRNRQTLRTILD